VKWQFSDQNSSWGSEHDMLIEDGKIYVVSNWLYAFDLNGNQLWVSKNIFYQEISIVDDLIIGYIEDNSPIVVALNKKDGIAMYFMTFGNVLNRPMRFSALVGN
jgi:hypothetical protein